MAIRLDEARLRLLKMYGELSPSVNNTYNIGTSSLKFANIYATTFHGALDGNAATATKLNRFGFTVDTIDNVTHSGLLYGTIGSYAGPGFSGNDAMILSMSFNDSNNYGAQIALDDITTPNMYIRNKNVSWSAWSKVLLSTNYTDYTVKKDGTGASGTWGINITGSSTSCTGNAATATNADKLDGYHASDFFINAGSNPTCGNGTAIILPGGSAIKTIRTTDDSGSRDVGIFYLSLDNAYIANSSDNCYTFGVFDTDLIQDFSSEENASFSVSSNGTGCKIRGNTVLHAGNYTNYAATKSHTHSYLPLSGGTMDNGARISHGGNLYIGTANNAGWIGLLDICSQDSLGDGKWSIRTNGNAIFLTCKGAVWNDYAEYRSAETIKPGTVVREDKDGIMKLTTERLMPACEIISDTFGFAIGETDEYKTPIAATGRVLAYPYEDRYSFELGDAVCSGPNGTVSKMTREELMMYPERMIGTVSEIPEYKTWGSGNVEVDGRIWIRIR